MHKATCAKMFHSNQACLQQVGEKTSQGRTPSYKTNAPVILPSPAYSQKGDNFKQDSKGNQIIMDDWHSFELLDAMAMR